MRTIISRWFLFGLLLGWALTHATVFGQSTEAKPSATDKVREGLDKVITVDFTGQSLPDVISHLRHKTGLTITFDPLTSQVPFDPNNGGQPPAPITVKATKEKASQVLRKLLNANQLCYVIIDDAILVTTEDLAAVRQYRQRVSVDFDEVPLKKAARDLAKKHGINLVIDPKIAKQAETAVSLQVENTGVETALRVLAELASLKAVRMGNVTFITSEEKAKKIRDEEPHQLDSPLNSNLPLGIPPVLRVNGGFTGPAPTDNPSAGAECGPADATGDRSVIDGLPPLLDRLLTLRLRITSPLSL